MSLISSLKCFDAYFRGENSQVLKHHIKNYASVEALKKNFFETTILENPEVEHWVTTIAKSLNISQQDWEKHRSKNRTIYQFFLKLSQQGYSQSDYIIDLINEKMRFTQFALLTGGGLLLTTLATLIATSTLHVVWDIIAACLSSLYAVPILGMLWGLTAGLFTAYWTRTDEKMTMANRVRDILFITLSTVARVAASLLLIGAGAIMSPGIALIFIASSAVELFKDIYCLMQESVQYMFSPPLTENDPLSVHRAYARHVFGKEKRMEAIKINLVAALIIFVVMTLWCFFPGGGIVVALAVAATLGLVYTTKYFWLNHSESSLREQLQKQLSDLEIRYTNENQADEDFFFSPTRNPNSNGVSALPTSRVEKTTTTANSDHEVSCYKQPFTRLYRFFGGLCHPAPKLAAEETSALLPSSLNLK